jgi:hypothetical protein
MLHAHYRFFCQVIFVYPGILSTLKIGDFICNACPMVYALPAIPTGLVLALIHFHFARF